VRLRRRFSRLQAIRPRKQPAFFVYCASELFLKTKLAGFEMKTIRGKTFNGQRVVLDGKAYFDCQFVNSTLIIEGNGLFEMQNCKIEEDCRLSVEGPGQVLLHTLKLMLHSGGWMSQVANNVLHTVRQPPKALAQAAQK
jgi:hypothetical protein